jgi:uncharacterized small protein (DUF1192 family)
LNSTINAILSLRPGAKFELRGNLLTWLDEVQTEPSAAEIEAEVARLIAEQPRKEAEANRASAYRSEADPLFFKAQRGEATTDEWTAKVAEIKARFPYPGGDQ